MIKLLCIVLVVALAKPFAPKMINTPFGPRSYVKEYPSGTLIDTNNMIVTYPNQTTAPFFTDVNEPHPMGWIADTVYTAPTGSSIFTGYWKVPPLPDSPNDGQTLYLFTGIQPTFASPLVIAQPVLAYGQEPGQKWTLASWFCCTAGHSSPISASPGDDVFGSIQYDSTKDEWQIITRNENTSQQTVLNVKTTEKLNQYFVTLETYNTKRCSDYPTGSTTFTQLQAKNLKGEDVKLQWQNQERSDACRDEPNIINEQTVEIVYSKSN